jgi:hypothetical protein
MFYKQLMSDDMVRSSPLRKSTGQQVVHWREIWLWGQKIMTLGNRGSLLPLTWVTTVMFLISKT